MQFGDRFGTGRIRYAPGASLGPRIQTSLQLVYVEQGEAVITVDGVARRVGAGQATLLMPGGREHFSFSTAGETLHGWRQADVPELSVAQLRCLSELPLVCPVSARLGQLFEVSLPAAHDWEPTARAVRAGLIRCAILEYLQSAGYRHKAHQRLPTPLAKAVRLIDESLTSSLDLTVLAKAAGVTPQHLNRLFRQHLGTRPMRYLWQQRTREGARLLRQTGLSIGEAGYRCGFQSATHFSRLIKARYAVCPRTLRRQAWGGESLPVPSVQSVDP